MASASEQLINSAVFNQSNGNLAVAEGLYRQVLQQEPQNAVALTRLGAMLVGMNRAAEAVGLFERALKVSATAAGYANLASALRSTGRVAEAAAACRKAIEIKPDHAIAHCTLGMCLQEQGDHAGAEAALRQALRIKPDYVNAMTTLGSMIASAGRIDEGVELLRDAVWRDPKSPVAHYNLALVLHGLGKLDEAIAHHQQAIAIWPEYEQAHYAISGVLREQGRITEALRHVVEAIRQDPKDVHAHNSFLMYLCYEPSVQPAEIFAQHRTWAQRHAAPLAAERKKHTNDRSPGRRIRIGYLSSLFNGTVIGRYIHPLLTRHDHDQFEIVCYSSTKKADEVTARLRSCADAWREVGKLSDVELAELIRADGIDIAVDLHIHATRCHLLALARKPAPVQATYAAYPGTSGVDAIDYHISDPHMNPPGGPQDAFYSEKIALLPNSFWCYEPPTGAPAVGPLPADKNGFVTFGSLNGMVKQSHAVLAWWGEILRVVPGSRLALLLRGGMAGSPSFAKRLADAGIDPKRVTVFDYAKTDVYMGYYNSIDIALDPLPYGGHSTSLDALYMGVPVVTLPTDRPWGRAGLTFVSALVLWDLVAGSAQQYVDIAVALAKDPGRLRELRAGLRGRMEKSALMDAAAFTRDLEKLYRGMWQQYCEQGS